MAAMAAAVLVLSLPALVFAWTRELPAFDGLKDYRPLISTRVLGIDGTEVFVFARERRTVVPFAEIPEVMRKAVLASEDAKFYEHQGLNWLAIARCAAKGLWRGRVACGGSTITQQVVKTFLLPAEGRVKRKVKELWLAPRLEEKLSKDEILFLYLSQIYFGHGRYGVEEAARFYFGKSVRDVTLGEAAMLAGVVQSPMRLSPARHPEAAKERQRYVLRRMAEEGFLTPAQAEAEAARPLQVTVPPADPPGAWYADAVRRHLDERYGAERVETDGLTVEVAMDPLMQRAAEQALQAQLRAVDRRHGWRGPLQHLDEPQREQALPVWRERLSAVKARPGEVLVWDLARVSSDGIEAESESDIRRMARVRRLEPEGLYTALVVDATDRQATVDLGNALGTFSLAETTWARKWNPTSATAAPRKMRDVVVPGDVVLVRVLAGRKAPVELARAGKPLALALEQVPRVQGALVAVDPATRGVRALVGGYDFQLSQFNRALQARRQPGSAMKPFVWGAAIESRRFTPATVVYDTPDVYRDPWTGKDWKPQNFERNEYDGPMLLGEALAHSKNTVSAKLVDALGVDAVIDFARRAGIESELPRSLSLALGTGEVTPLELVNAYATIAAGGAVASPVTILRVRDRSGEVLEEHIPEPAPPAPVPPPPPTPALAAGTEPPSGAVPASAAPPADAVEPPPTSGMRPEVAFVLSAMMRGVVEFGTGQGAQTLGQPAAAKTGTAQDHRDAWFVGFTPELVAGAWVGFDSHDPMGPRETGGGAALPAWVTFMKEAVGQRVPVPFAAPPRVEFARIDRTTGLLAAEAAPADAAPFVAFLAGTAPASSASERQAPGSAPQTFFQDDR
ncbi:MAG: PBP1A family penicillin-binding protein [Deltaproteobacteria bacterium]|nr:PBP1A family penicillin-binding protein [Deltaproteobacteria bacterium]